MLTLLFTLSISLGLNSIYFETAEKQYKYDIDIACQPFIWLQSPNVISIAIYICTLSSDAVTMLTHNIHTQTPTED